MTVPIGFPDESKLLYMSRRNFYLQLGILSAATVVGIFLLNKYTSLSAYQDLSWISVVFFLTLTVIMYNLGLSATRSDNKNQFTNVVMGFTFFKMMLSLLIVISYNKLAEPDTKLFVIPFFGIYIVYTLFEVWFMTKLGRMNA